MIDIIIPIILAVGIIWLFRGRVDSKRHSSVFYEASNVLRIPHVRLRWEMRMAIMRIKGTVMVIPSPPPEYDQAVTWDDEEAFICNHKLDRTKLRTHYLRIQNNNPMHDTTFDKIAFELIEEPKAILFKTKAA